MQIDKSTFCSAPWFQIRNQNNMTKRVCCNVTKFVEDESTNEVAPLDYLNLPHIKKLKEQLTTGQRPKACQLCWHSEDSGNISLRNITNDMILGDQDKNWSTNYFKNKKDFSSDIIVSADVKIGNTCNHACVMCNADNSSLLYNDWIKRKDSPFVQEILAKEPDYFEQVKFQGYKNKTYRKYLEDSVLNNNHLNQLKILGGEPFMDKTLLENLRLIPQKRKDKMTLTFVTNGSIDFVPILESIGNFHHTSLIVSLEGVGEVQEFARAGSKWSTVEKNILKGLKNKLDVRIHHSMQTATILGFQQLIQWCKKNRILLSCGMVDGPDYLSIASLPTNLKNQIIKDILPYETSFATDVDIESGHMEFNKLILMIKDYNFNKKLHKKFFEYIEWYQSNKQIPKLKNIFPELYSYRKG